MVIDDNLDKNRSIKSITSIEGGGGGVYVSPAAFTASSTGFSRGFLGNNERGRIVEHGKEIKARAEAANGKEKVRERTRPGEEQ